MTGNLALGADVEAPALTCQWILLVEDDPDSREIFQELLRGEGYAVAAAPDGEAALEVLRHASRPCLVITDWRMPTMDGSRFLALLFERDVTLRHRIVVLSGAREAARVRSEPDVVAVLTKPVEIQALLDLVGAHCLRSSAVSGLSGSPSPEGNSHEAGAKASA